MIKSSNPHLAGEEKRNGPVEILSLKEPNFPKEFFKDTIRQFQEMCSLENACFLSKTQCVFAGKQLPLYIYINNALFMQHSTFLISLIGYHYSIFFNHILTYNDQMTTWALTFAYGMNYIDIICVLCCVRYFNFPAN